MKKTPRQELIEKSSEKMVIFGIEPEWAIEAVLDGAPFVTGAAMEKYYDSLSEKAVKRLIIAIKRIHASRIAKPVAL